jgi:hypothetical protein
VVVPGLAGVLVSVFFVVTGGEVAAGLAAAGGGGVLAAGLAGTLGGVTAPWVG